MNLTKDDLVKLLTEMRDTAWFCYTEFKRDRKSAMKNQYFGEYLVYDKVIRMLTKPEFAEEMWDIFFSGEEAAS